MEPVVARLRSVTPIIESIMSISGTVGLTYGVLHEGKVIHQQSFGYRDREKELAVDELTLFPICSLTKAITASAIGNLVEDEKLSWDTKIKDALPEFRTRSEELYDRVTILDYISMRSGMQSQNIWLQSQNNIIFPPSESLKIINSFQSTQPLRSAFAYDNWAYEIAGLLITHTSKEPWGSYVARTILDPLGLQRTGSNLEHLDTSNVARAYTVLDSGKPNLIRDVTVSEQTLMGPSGGMRSCIADLLKYYTVYLDTYQHMESSGMSSSPETPFKQLRTITSPHIDITIPHAHGQSYCLGWAKGQLPGPLGVISNNFRNLGVNVPRVGKGLSPIEFLNAAGSMAGAMAAITLFPASRSAIVVLTNTYGLSDSSDTVSQLLTEHLFDSPEKNDFVEVTKRIRAVELKFMATVAERLEQERTSGNKPRELKEYTGRYQNATRVMTIDVALEDRGLVMRFQGLEEESYSLKHYEYDTFSWWLTRNECAKKGRFASYNYTHYKVKFAPDKTGKIGRLLWKNVPRLTDPEIFEKLWPSGYGYAIVLTKPLCV